jgi:hypothetical protein
MRRFVVDSSEGSANAVVVTPSPRRTGREFAETELRALNPRTGRSAGVLADFARADTQSRRSGSWGGPGRESAERNVCALNP